MPKWHDATCESVLKQINQTSLLVKKYPKSQYLKTQLLGASKQYKKLLNSKQKLYLNKMFDDLDNLKNNNPRGNMNIGSFDKKSLMTVTVKGSAQL